MSVARWLTAVLCIGLASVILSEQGAADPVRNLTLTVSAPVGSGLRDLAGPVDDFIKGVTDRGELVRENEQLRARVEELERQLAAQQDAQQRAADLEQALGLRESRPDDQLKAANVIAIDPSGLKRMAAIDAGIDDGLDEGMVVLSKNGSLVGTVARAYESYSWIRLITDPESVVNAQVNPSAPPAGDTGGGDAVLPPGTPAPQEQATPQPQPSPPAAPVEPIRAVAEGDLGDELVLGLLPSNATIQLGDLVVTSGLGGNFPRALLIGAVSSVQERPQAPFKTARVRPAADLSSLDMVLVILNFKPQRLVAP